MTRYEQLELELTRLLNSLNIDGDFQTPDYILASYLMAQLRALSDIENETRKWRVSKS